MAPRHWSPPGSSPLRHCEFPPFCCQRQIAQHLVSETLELRAQSYREIAENELRVTITDIGFTKEGLTLLKHDPVWELKILIFSTTHDHNADPDHELLDETVDEFLMESERKSAIRRMRHLRLKTQGGEPWPAELDPSMANLVDDLPISRPPEFVDDSDVESTASAYSQPENEASNEMMPAFDISDNRREEDESGDWEDETSVGSDFENMADSPDPTFDDAMEGLVFGAETKKFFVYNKGGDDPYFSEDDCDTADVVLQMWMRGSSLKDIHDVLLQRNFCAKAGNRTLLGELQKSLGNRGLWSFPEHRYWDVFRKRAPGVWS